MGFDYIIIGAGSAGCILADRLSRDGKNKVLVLEAGGSDKRFWIKVPLGYGFTFADPKVTWKYMTQPDPGLNSRPAYWPRGRVLGGSSSINAMAYVRGLPHDFDDWEQAGASGWGWNSVRLTYDALESHDEFASDGQRIIRGTGALRVSDLSRQMHPFSARFLEAAQDLGWSTPPDMNAPGAEGLSYYRSSVRDGLRCSSADAFLRPALKRNSVHLETNAVVDRLVLDGTRVTGVRYRQGSTLKTANAKAEVILSAGAINSPQLLQLSGIGPASLLQSHGIQVVQDLPHVGQGLQDHLAITHHFASTEPTLNNRLGGALGQFMAGVQYILTRKGPLSVPVNQVGGFVRSKAAVNPPDMQVYCNPASYNPPVNGRPSLDKEAGFILSVQPCRPTSRGSISIASADPTEAPLIQPNSLSTHHDREEAIAACKLLRQIAETPTITRLTQTRRTPDVVGMDDDEMLENFRNRAATNFHPTCTCKMGHDAADSVLDNRLRVHGVQGVRVVDASAFPNVTSGNTNAPTMMLAMRAADLILEDARLGAL